MCGVEAEVPIDDPYMVDYHGMDTKITCSAVGKIMTGIFAAGIAGMLNML